MKRLVGLACVVLLAAGCGHAKSREKTGTTAAAKPIAPHGVPVGPTPSSVLQKGAAKKIQRALDQKGYSVHQSGHIDGDTRKALEKFQRDQKMAATGIPDLKTLELLGLEPTDIYRHER
jgi:hypothetical protein